MTALVLCSQTTKSGPTSLNLESLSTVMPVPPQVVVVLPVPDGCGRCCTIHLPFESGAFCLRLRLAMRHDGPTSPPTVPALYAASRSWLLRSDSRVAALCRWTRST